MCVDGFGPEQIASCVYTGLFDDFLIDKDGNIKGMMHGEVFDVAKAHAILSKSDKKTLIETESMSVEAWGDSVALAKGAVQTKTCRHCADLETDVLPLNTDSLRVEATLMSTGAIAGIIWLALSTG